MVSDENFRSCPETVISINDDYHNDSDDIADLQGYYRHIHQQQQRQSMLETQIHDKLCQNDTSSNSSCPISLSRYHDGMPALRLSDLDPTVGAVSQLCVGIR